MTLFSASVKSSSSRLQKERLTMCCSWRASFIILLGLVILAGIVAGVYFLIGSRIADSLSFNEFGEKIGLRARKHRGAVVSNGLECAKIGRSLLERNGSAVDAIIGVMFCEDVTGFADLGIGGSFLMTVYTKATGKVEMLDAREVAPAAAHEKMFEGLPPSSSFKGGLAIAAPTQVKGLWELHKKYGRLPWREVMLPAIEVAENGHYITDYTAYLMKQKEKDVQEEPSVASMYLNPKTGETWKEGTWFRHPQLAKTLRIIAEEGGDVLYTRNSTLLRNVLDDLKKFGSVLTEDDFVNYSVKWREPVTCEINGFGTLYSTNLPGGGPILCFILNVVQGFKLENTAESWHRVIEAFKHAYAKRSHLGDPDFVPEAAEMVKKLLDPDYAAEIRSKIKDRETSNRHSTYGAKFEIPKNHGTANIAVLAPNGDAVVTTTTINTILGAMVRSESTGILFNSQMDDFGLPGVINDYGTAPAPANFIAPGKRPMSSKTPSILLDGNGDVRMMIGGAGGPKIPTSNAFTIIQHFFLDKSFTRAVDAYRLHHQLFPMAVMYEKGFNVTILEELASYGHKLQATEADGFGAVTGLSRVKGDCIDATFDVRRGGSVEVLS